MADATVWLSRRELGCLRRRERGCRLRLPIFTSPTPPKKHPKNSLLSSRNLIANFPLFLSLPSSSSSGLTEDPTENLRLPGPGPPSSDIATAAAVVVLVVGAGAGARRQYKGGTIGRGQEMKRGRYASNVERARAGRVCRHGVGTGGLGVPGA